VSGAAHHRCIDVLACDRDEGRASALVRRRAGGVLARLARGSSQHTRVVRTVYWPLAFFDASASTMTLRGRPWQARVATAADLVTGRLGVVDIDLPDLEPLAVSTADILAARWEPDELEDRWREFFRAYVHRRYRPLRAPELSIDRLRRAWLPYHVVAAGSRTYLVDLLTRRVDRLEDYEEVREVVAGPRHPEDVPAAGLSTGGMA
jgi:hypothetical protein